MKIELARGIPLSDHEIARIRSLRYEDGLTIKQVAQIVDRSDVTVRRYAPGRPGKVPVAPLREAFLASPMTAIDVARELGWWAGYSHGAPRLDSGRVKRTLGIYATDRGSYRTLVDAETVRLIAEAIGISPWSVLPDDEERAA